MQIVQDFHDLSAGDLKSTWEALLRWWTFSKCNALGCLFYHVIMPQAHRRKGLGGGEGLDFFDNRFKI
jgi:hypothetical protein